MKLQDAIELGIIVVDTDRILHYNGLCNECKHSECKSDPARSNVCINKQSEWYGAFHVDYDLQRFVNGCSVFEKKETDKLKTNGLAN